jgi:hypothetical protein
MNRVQHKNWIPGAVLRVYSKRWQVWHFGIAGSLTVQGPMVMHASKDRGQFVLTTCDEFSEGEPIEYTWVPESLEEQQAVLTRAEGQLGNPYRLSDLDCEDYVNWIVTGVARSPQREEVALAVLIFLAVFGIGGMLSA